MFKIELIARGDDGNDESKFISMEQTFETQPDWGALMEPYLSFLKANGYIFNYNAYLDVVNNETDDLIPDDLAEEEAEAEAQEKVKRGKGKKKK